MGVFDRILITGGGGMLAHALVDSLRQRGFEPMALDRTSLDVAQEASVVMEGIISRRPSLILNCAAFTKVDACEVEAKLARRVNGFATAYIAAAAAAIGARLVHYSTDYVFDGTLRRPLKPNDPVGPQSAYGQSKLLGERLLQQSASKDWDWLIIRTAWLYGPGGPNFPQAILNAARAGKPLTVVNDQIGSPTFTFDLAQATLELIEKQAKGIWHIVNDGETTWHDFAAEILERFDVRASLSPISSEDWKKSRPSSAIRPSYSVLDTTPFQQLTGHRTPHWKDALKRFSQIE